MPGLPARNAALHALTAVLERHQPLDPLLAGGRWTELEPRDRAFARLISVTVLRRLYALDAAIDRFLKAPDDIPPRIRNILRLAAAQLLYLETGAHAAVNAAVAQAGGHVAGRRYKGLVNAVARRMAEDAQAIRTGVDQISNTPPWLRARWERVYGAGTVRAIEAAHLAEPPLHLTVREHPEQWAQKLGGTLLPTGSVAIPTADVTGLPGFHEGAWWVQDTAASLPVRLLGDVRDEPVYDLCAAPGGKTAQLALAGGRVTALDHSPERLSRLRNNLDRLRLDAELVTGDLLTWQAEGTASRVLLDAPCTATGTICRHPDVTHIKTASDIISLGSVQAEMLSRAADVVAPGGVLVYCTCSLEPEEGPERVAALLAERPDFSRLPVTPDDVNGLSELISAEGDLRTLPCHLEAFGGMDGFFAARLIRKRRIPF